MPERPTLDGLVAAWTELPDLPSDVRVLVDSLASTSPKSLLVVLLFGSRLLETAPDEYSAYDLFVVVEDYSRFYRDLKVSGMLRHRPDFVAFLNRMLPPNVMSYRPGPPASPLAKCFVISEKDLERALSERPRDHFCLGRLSQRSAIVYARDPEARERMVRNLVGAVRAPLRWAAPFTPGSFSPEGFCRRMLEVSFSGEIRPESSDRVDAVHRAQTSFFREVYGQALAEAAESGRVVGAKGIYRFPAPPSARDRARGTRYFELSKVRATLRWFKYILTFDDWLEYIRRKAERRAGASIELTPMERRFPLVFLWPKAISVLRTARKRKEATR